RFIVSDREDPNAGSRASENEPGDCHECNEEEAPRSLRACERVRVGGWDGTARLREDPDRKPLQDRERRQGDEYWLETAVGNEDPVEGTEGCAEGEDRERP